jgi:hypothetical protein
LHQDIYMCVDHKDSKMAKMENHMIWGSRF